MIFSFKWCQFTLITNYLKMCKLTQVLMSITEYSYQYVCSTYAVQRSHITEWDIAETQGKGPFPEILKYDIFVNCILLNEVLVVKHDC